MKKFIHLQAPTACKTSEAIPQQTSDAMMHQRSDSNASHFIRTFILSITLLLLSVPVMAQLIGSPNVCAGSTTSLSCISLGGTWSSSNTSVATVNPGTGVVTGVSAGSAIISYTLLGIPLTMPFTVNPLPNAGSIMGPTTVCLGYSTTTLSISGTVGGPGFWSTPNSIVSVGGTSGIVTGNTIGADSIKYTVTNGCGTSVAAVNMNVLGQLGYIYTYGGTGIGGFSGDNGPAYLAQMGNPRDIYFDAINNFLYFCDPQNNRVRKVTTTGIISTVAGSSGVGNAGDGGQATSATLLSANGIYADPAGNLFISNTGYKTVRKVNTSGIISTIAGTGAVGSTGDGGQATAATLNFPLGILEDSAGNVYIADQGNNNVRKIDPATGIITTIAGSPAGTSGYSGDGGPASACLMFGVRGVAMDYWGNMYFADAFNNRVRKYVPSTGIMTCIAGNGIAGHTGDGGPATAAEMYNPSRFAYDGANILYVSDQASQVIRSINLATGIINTVAGNAATGFSGDYGAATAAEINTPAGIAVDHVGNFYIADAVNNRVRIVSTNGSVRLIGPMNVDAGTPVTYTADLSAPGTATYQFVKNGTYVTGSGATYTNTAPANGDVYQVIATVTPPCGSSYTLTSNVINLTVNPTITASAGPNGSISPSGFLSLPSGNQTYTITPNTNCHTTSVVVDGSSAGAITSYTFTAPTPVAHTIVASFAPNCSAPTISSPATSTSVTCYGGSDGSVTTSVTCSSPVTYLWSNGDTTANLTNVPSGIYSYTATAPCGSVSGSVTVSQPSALIATATITQASCHGGAASVDVSAAGGTGAYTGTGPFSLADGTSSTYTIQDANLCSATSNSVTAASPAAVVATASITQASCHGSAASVSVTATGGTGTYTGTGTFSLADGTSSTYTVHDANSCSATSSSVTAISPAAVSASASAGAISCHGGTTYVTLTGSGGTGTLRGTGTFTGVGSGTHSYTVTDANGCSATASVSITEPAALSVSGTTTNEGCYGASTGSVTTSVSGGVSSYTYSWSNSATTSGISGLTAGAYSVTVTDANRCVAAGSYTITQPAAIFLAATAGANGTVSPPGTTAVCPGARQVYTITPAAGYSIYDVLVDGASVGAVTSYTFTSVSASHTIEANFISNTCNLAVTSNFNGTPVTSGKKIWFNSVLKINGSATYPLTIDFVNQTISSPAFSLSIPDGELILDPSVAIATTIFDGTKWITTAPPHESGNYFISGYRDSLTSALPEGLNPVTWTATVVGSSADIKLNWQWAAAVYTSLNSNLASIGVKPSDCNSCSSYPNSDHAGTPENYKSYVIGGARGGGGSNYTGSYSGTGSIKACETTGHKASEPYNNGKETIEGSVKVYPNPTDGTFNVVIPSEQKSAEIFITDITGRTIDIKSVTENDGTPVEFNTGHLTPGIYLVKINAGDYSTVVKLAVR